MTNIDFNASTEIIALDDYILVDENVFINSNGDIAVVLSDHAIVVKHAN